VELQVAASAKASIEQTLVIGAHRARSLRAVVVS